ncbi:MAG: hypothetical protein ABR562_03475 [Thermoplasmatota archaeon]
MSPPPQRTPADSVMVQDGVKEDFFDRHRKDLGRAEAVWRSLVAKAPQLKADTSFGPMFLPPKLPRGFVDLHPLRVLKGLPFAFRAVYVVEQHPTLGILVSIEWVGDHGEYERLFGY